MNSLIYDVRTAWRQLLLRPLLSGSALLVLALGLGACATVFSLVNAIYFKPLGFAAPERLVQIYETSATQLCPGCVGRVSVPTFRDMRDGLSELEGIAAFGDSALAVESAAGTEPRSGAVISPGLFDLLGVQPAFGAGFRSEDGSVDGVPGVLLAAGYAEQRFGAATSALGQPLRINGIEHRVLGVMPSGFRFPEFAELWVPLDSHRRGNDRGARELVVVGRLAADAESLPFAERTAALGRQLATEHSAEFGEWQLASRPFRIFFSEGAGQFFSVLLAAVAVVLLVTCANLAGLVLARSSEREAELGVRSALGAGRLRLLRQLLVEYTLLALGGGAAAVLVTTVGVHLVRLAMPAEVPYYFDFSPDLRVLMFTLALALLSVLGFGLWPALRASGVNLRDVLGAAGRGTAATMRSPARRALVAAEIGLTVLLLGIAAVLIGSQLQRPGSRLNYSLEGLHNTQVELLGPHFEEPQARQQSIAALRGALTAGGLPAALSQRVFFNPKDEPLRPGLRPLFGGSAVSPEYFEVLGLPLRQGRMFADSDLSRIDRVLVGESLARQLAPEQSAVGQRLRLHDPRRGPIEAEVIGVVADARRNQPGEPSPVELYLPLHEPGQNLSLHLRADGVDGLERRLQAATLEADPNLALRPLRDAAAADSGNWQPRFFALVLSSFAVLTLLAALVGLYGLIAGAVTLRRREFGLRMAMGARPTQIAGSVLREGLRLALLGAVPGTALALFLAPQLVRLLRHEHANTMLPVLALAVVFCAVAMIACYLPARRAGKVQPLTALRYD